MVSIASLRNRLAAAPSPSSPVRSRYSQAIWKGSSSSWESEMLMGRKRIPAACVPRHLRFATRFRPSTASGSERKITLPNAGLACFRGFTDRVMRITPISPKSAVRKSGLSGLVLRVGSDDGDLAAGPAVGRSGRQAKQRAGLADGPFRNDFLGAALELEIAILQLPMGRARSDKGSRNGYRAGGLPIRAAATGISSLDGLSTVQRWGRSLGQRKTRRLGRIGFKN